MSAKDSYVLGRHQGGGKAQGVLDPFRNRQVPDVAGRFLKEQRRHQRHADLMWLGAMAAMFSDHELRLLNDLGFMSQRDLDLLRQAGRAVQDEPVKPCIGKDCDECRDAGNGGTP